jgi:hypothetical protein
MLSSEQLETFERDGALILRGFYTPSEVAAWQEQVLDYFGRPTDPETWRTALATYKGDSFQPVPDLSPELHPKLRQVYDALYPTREWTGRTRLIVRTGNDPAEWRGPRLPHIDIPYNAPVRTLVNSVTYLSEVQPRGAAFIYWPGSHRVAWDYYSQFPEDFMAEGERSYNQVYQRITDRMTTEPVELIGSPGDVLILHSLTLHSASINKREATRIAIFGLWGVETDLERRHDFSQPMWRGWRFDREACAVAC